MTKSESTVLRTLSVVFSFIGILYYGYILIQSVKYNFREIRIQPNGGYDLEPNFSAEKFILNIPYFIVLIILLSLTVFTILFLLKQKKSYAILFISNTVILILSMFFINTNLLEFMFIKYNLPKFLFKFLCSLPNNTFVYLKLIPFTASACCVIPFLFVKDSHLTIQNASKTE